jgi:hypothetical protein
VSWRASAAAAAFALSALRAGDAQAVTVERYRVDVRRSERHPDALAVTVNIVQRARESEHRTRSIVSVGADEPLEVRVMAPGQHRLEHQVTREPDRSGWRIESSMSDPTTTEGGEERREVSVSFENEPDWRRSWLRDRATLVPLAQPTVPASEIEYRAQGFVAVEGAGCGRASAGWECRSRPLAPITVVRDASPAHTFGGALAGLALAAMIVAGAIALKLNDLAPTRVEPPAEPPPPPPVTLDPAVFRARPARRTKPKPRPIVFDRRLLVAYARRTVLTAAITPAVAGTLVATRGATMSVAWLMIIAFVSGALSAAWNNHEGEVRAWPSLVVAAAMIGPIDGGAFGLVVAVAAGLVLWLFDFMGNPRPPPRAAAAVDATQ